MRESARQWPKQWQMKAENRLIVYDLETQIVQNCGILRILLL